MVMDRKCDSEAAHYRLETPGHTPEGICLVVTEKKNLRSLAVLTGDTLFIGDVGRPTFQTHTSQQLAGSLYDTFSN